MQGKQEEEFTLSNPKPRQPPPKFETTPCRQNVLFSGMDCLPGQMDLFATDGGEAYDLKPEQPRS